MMLSILTVCLFFGYAAAGISDSCLACICSVESYGCTPLGCSDDGGTDACGYYQIQEAYYIDCNQPGSDWVSCARNKGCADQCVRTYVNRYGTWCTGKSNPSCEDYARIHNGGPTGCNKPRTDPMWNAVQACLAGK